MICGIGVDLVEIHSFNAQIARLKDGAFSRMFTPAERAAARQRKDPVEYLAGRFAAKEAIYKAVRPTVSGELDLRKIEILSRKDGSPFFQPSDVLKAQLDQAGIGMVHISISGETDYAIAFAVAVTAGEKGGRCMELPS